MTGLLNISEALSIAVHTCVWLAGADRAWVPVKRIAETLDFSRNHMAKVVQQLVRAGILVSARGPSGGVALGQSADTITLKDLYLATGGTPKTEGCLLASSICDGRNCLLGQAIAEENRRLFDLFSKTTVADLVKTVETKAAPDARKGKQK